jgi:histone deacetylase 1/2
MDTGATDHLTHELSKLNSRESYTGPDQVRTADGSGMRISHVGQASLLSLTSKRINLLNVLRVPSVTRNLLSVKKLTLDNDVFVEFHPFHFFVKDRVTRDVLLRGRSRHGLYVLDAPATPTVAQVSQVFTGVRVAPSQWHARLGHPATPVVRHVLRRHELPFASSNKDLAVCDACQQGKSHQLPFSESTHIVKAPLELVYSDVWGHTQISVSGHNYYVSFIDAYSRFTWLYLLKRKSDVFDVFIQFQAHVERILHHKIIHLQSDWGGEYRNLNTFFQKQGIVHRVACPHTHQQNGAAERKHRHIVETGLTLLAHASVPFRFWSDAFTTACFLINRLPTRSP